MFNTNTVAVGVVQALYLVDHEWWFYGWLEGNPTRGFNKRAQNGPRPMREIVRGTLWPGRYKVLRFALAR